MGIFTKVAVFMGGRKTGLENIKDTQEYLSPSSQSVPTGDKLSSRTAKFDKFGQFAPVMRELDRAFHELHEEIQGHRAFNSFFICNVSNIRICPINDSARDILQKLFRNCESKDIANAIEREILSSILKHCFDLSDMSISLNNDDNVQPLLNDQLRQELLGAATTQNGNCQVRIDIEWTLEHSQPGSSFLEIKGWRLHDANGDNQVNLRLSDPNQIILLGNDDSGQVHILVRGKYTSLKHGKLWLDGEQYWWYQDLGSTNGSRVIRPRQSDWVSPARRDGEPADPVELIPGATLVFAANPTNDDPSDYPKLEVERVVDRRGTPINPSVTVATRSTPNASRNASPASADHGAGIQIEDVNGQRVVSVDVVPCMVGRSSKHLFRIPNSHQSVSRDHLEILAFEKNGLRIRLLGKNGATLAGTPMNQGEEAIWVWGQELILGYPRENEPVCRLTLQQVMDTGPSP